MCAVIPSAGALRLDLLDFLVLGRLRFRLLGPEALQVGARDLQRIEQQNAALVLDVIEPEPAHYPRQR